MKKTSLILILILAGCANPNYKRNLEIVENAKNNFQKCWNYPNQKHRADCALYLYNQMKNMSDDDYGKLPALKMATSTYALGAKLDLNQITEQESRYQIMQIENQFNQDMIEAKNRTDAQNRAAATQQQQMFLNAQRMLAPQTNTLTCTKNMGGPTFGPMAGAMTCQ